MDDNTSSVIGKINKVSNFIKLISDIFHHKNILKCYFNKSDFIILNFEKDITIYGNGHGITTCSFDIYVLRPEKFTDFYKAINIEDGDKNSAFPSLNDMLNCSRLNRFSEYGFWYKCDSDIISRIEECYWSDLSKEIVDKRLKLNPQELRWRFIMDTSKIEKNQTYNITYSLSVPGMYPIKDYKFCPDKKSDVFEEMETSLSIEHYANRIEYNLAFEKGDTNNRFKFTKRPQALLFPPNGNSNQTGTSIKGIFTEDLFYTRIKYIISDPQYNSSVKIKWDIE